MLPLCSELAAGVKDSTGAVCASYVAYLYNPGTTNAFTGAYENDGTTPVTSPVTLDVAGRYFLRAATPFRVLVKTAVGGTTVYDHEVNITDAAQARYNGTLHDNVDTTVAAMLDDAAAAIGPGFKLHAGAASLGILLKNWCNGVHVDVTGEDVGGGNPVVGDGTVDCTAGIQAAITLVGSLGGGVVFFPSGTYKITAPITVAHSNVALVGTGPGSIIKNTANTNAIVIGSALQIYYDARVLDLAITSTGSTGYAIVTYGTRTTIERCNVSGHAIGVQVASPGGSCRVLFSTVSCTALAGSRGIQFAGDGQNYVIGCVVSGGGPGKAIEFTNVDTGATRIVGCHFGLSAVGVSFTAGFAGVPSFISDSTISGATDAVEALGSALPIQIVGCDLRGYTVNVTSGGNHTPDLTKCNTTNAVIDIHGTSNGANWTVNAPTPAPAATDLDAQFILVCKNDVAATGWTLNAAYHVSLAPSNTNGERTSYLFRWNGTVWHEVSRSVTT